MQIQQGGIVIEIVQASVKCATDYAGVEQDAWLILQE